MAQIADLIGGVTTRDGPPVPVRHVVEPSRKDACFLVDRSCGNIFSMNHFYMMTNGGVGVEWLFVVCCLFCYHRCPVETHSYPSLSTRYT